MTEAQIEAKKEMNGLITTAHALQQVCNDLDSVTPNQVPPVSKLLNACNDTVLASAQVVKESAVGLIELQAANETLREYVTMMADFILEKGLLSEYIKHTEKYE